MIKKERSKNASLFISNCPAWPNKNNTIISEMVVKILRVAADFYPSVVGGIGLHAYEMSKLQAKMGHNVVVYTTKTNSESEVERLDGFQVIRFKPLIKIFGNSITISMFNKLTQNKNRFDIIHAHSHLFFSTNLCALIRKVGMSPLVITNHGLNSQTAPEWFQNLYTATGAKWTFGKADKIICYTEAEKQELIDLGINPQKIVVIHNGIDTDLFVPRKKGSQNNIQLLWIGRFIHGKGVDHLVDAFKIINIKHPDIKLLLVGRGPERELIKRKIGELGLDMSISIKDFISNSDIAKLYQNSNVFVLPSLEEGVPRTILESMSCGVPVVCSELPQLVDIVEGCGFLVPKKDSQAIADRVLEILSDSSLAKKMGENGREKVIRNYSWKDTVEKTIELYKELI